MMEEPFFMERQSATVFSESAGMALGVCFMYTVALSGQPPGDEELQQADVIVDRGMAIGVFDGGCVAEIEGVRAAVRWEATKATEGNPRFATKEDAARHVAQLMKELDRCHLLIMDDQQIVKAAGAERRTMEFTGNGVPQCVIYGISGEDGNANDKKDKARMDVRLVQVSARVSPPVEADGRMEKKLFVEIGVRGVRGDGDGRDAEGRALWIVNRVRPMALRAASGRVAAISPGKSDELKDQEPEKVEGHK